MNNYFIKFVSFPNFWTKIRYFMRNEVDEISFYYRRRLKNEILSFVVQEAQLSLQGAKQVWHSFFIEMLQKSVRNS